MRWRVRVGAPWRDVPSQYGSCAAVYGLFRRWQRDGTWQQILTALQAWPTRPGGSPGACRWTRPSRGVDQHAAGARKRGDLQAEPPGGVWDEPADHALGRCRGGLITKLHLAREQGQSPLSLIVTAGQRGDSSLFIAVLGAIRVPRLRGGRPRTRPDRVLADKAYTSQANRDYLRHHGIKATIPSMADQDVNRRKKGSKGGRPPTFDPQLYQQRHAVECGINRLSTQCRGHQARKLAVRYEATVHFAAINEWL